VEYATFAAIHDFFDPETNQVRAVLGQGPSVVHHQIACEDSLSKLRLPVEGAELVACTHAAPQMIRTGLYNVRGDTLNGSFSNMYRCCYHSM
jgi:hypothetical protein